MNIIRWKIRSVGKDFQLRQGKKKRGTSMNTPQGHGWCLQISTYLHTIRFIIQLNFLINQILVGIVNLIEQQYMLGIDQVLQ